ncbi:hypothetical protein F5882DRAFT_458569 [Hyaloscypha sp. PMI_1271]|nr:hypothetical protein F5882DRAFT_458569 [Hyaloscypha sp. PMI_1271]
MLLAITVALKGTSLDAFWVGISYLLAQTVTIPLHGTISDIFGRKWVMGLGGGGGYLLLASVIISDITTLRDRPKFLIMGAFAWALGTNIGVPGGAIGEFSSWRVVFCINIPICVIGTAGLIYALHFYQETLSLRSKLVRID